MSSMDQVFVKAFSRRRLAEPERDAGRQSPQLEASQAPDDIDASNQLGSLQLNRSVAGTAEVWVDKVDGQIARPDQASLDVPKPHVPKPHVDRALKIERTVTFEAPQTDTEVGPDALATPPLATSPVRAKDQAGGGKAIQASEVNRLESPVLNPAPLQHIHTAYAGAFADPSLIAASTYLEESVAIAAETQELQPTPENTLPRSLPQSESASGVDDLLERAEEKHRSKSDDGFSTSSRTLLAESIEPRPAVEETPFIDMRIDPPAPVAEVAAVTSDPATPDPATSYVPFQPVWEVDVFDVPSPVADLFFEGALFQQIAERMSDAVSSGLKTVLVTSTKPGEGRSCVAIGMAMAAAAAGIRVALVDADTESPSLADELRLDLQYGWVDVIRRGLPIKEIAVQAVEDGVTLIPLMPPGVRPAATAFEVVQLVDLLTSNFELIILDGPTSLSSGLQQCASRVDSAVIVRDVTRTDELDICKLSNRLQGVGVRGVGVVENFV